MLTVEIFDSSPVYAEGLIRILERHGFQAASSEIPFGPCACRRADVLVVGAATVSPEAIARFLGSGSNGPPVLLILERMDEIVANGYKKAGVRGAIDRSSGTGTLLEAISTIVAGGHFWSTSPAQGGKGESGGANELRALPALSPRERQVLHHIARGLTHRQIASKLNVSQHTVDTYVKRIRSKLDLGNKAELTRAALRDQHRWQEQALKLGNQLIRQSAIKAISH